MCTRGRDRCTCGLRRGRISRSFERRQSSDTSQLRRHLKGLQHRGLAVWEGAIRCVTFAGAWPRARLVASGADISPACQRCDSNEPETDFHRRFLFMLRGELPRDDEVATLDTTQILQMEHSFNAGTFAGRVCASTEAPLQSVGAVRIGGRPYGGNLGKNSPMSSPTWGEFFLFLARCLK